MEIFEREKEISRCSLKKEIISELDNKYGENSVENLLDMLLGGIDEPRHYKYKLYKYKESKKTILNRLNMLWVFPIFLVSIPLQWLILGDIGVSRDSRIGKIIEYLVRF